MTERQLLLLIDFIIAMSSIAIGTNVPANEAKAKRLLDELYKTVEHE